MLKIFLSGILFLILTQPLLAQEREFSIYQGVISSAEQAPEYIIIDERKFPLAGDVKVKDYREKDATLSDLKPGKWVYIVSEQSSTGDLTAKRIYILPRYIKKGEKQNYPFMKREEESNK
ncbi:MAG: hypothetical protein HZA12_01790 [Nitrospirae bacterium]|nr:hypothetical protein [Nitrospirota bacterium]